MVIGTTPEVQYLYAGPTGATSDGRATGMIYPNGRQEDYVYHGGPDSSVSRISALADHSGDGAGNIESYSYLGLDTIVQRNRPNGVNLTYAKLSGESNGSAGDQYTGLDEFGRVIDQRWTTSTGTNVERYQYGYDADSNVMYKDNLSTGTNALTFSELYHGNASGSGYDALNRLTEFERGQINGQMTGVTPSGTAGIDQVWTLDAVGNWSSLSTNGTPQSRSVNQRNEYSAVGSNTPTYDNNGNLTKDENGQQYVYDAWNRLKQVKNSSGTVLVTYTYDASGRRVVEAVNGGSTTDVYFDTSGNVIEERVGGTVTRQDVWGIGAPDLLVLRDDNLSGTHSYGVASGGLTERIFVQQDANTNVTGLVDTSGNVLERFAYDPYGKKYVENANWSPVSDGYSWLYTWQAGRQDATSGLIHFGEPGRDYSTSLGRWTEPDPTGYIDGANLYQADGSAPSDRIDPSGLIMTKAGNSPHGHWEWREYQTPDGSYGKLVWVPDKIPPGTMEPMDVHVLGDGWHAKIGVDVYGPDGSVVGTLTGEFAPDSNQGFWAGLKMSLGTVGGHTTCTFMPGKGNLPPYKTAAHVSGGRERDDRLLKWILKTSGLNKAWLDNAVKSGQPRNQVTSNHGTWKHYNWWAHSCTSYAIDGMTKWLGHDWHDSLNDPNVTGEGLVDSVQDYFKELDEE